MEWPLINRTESALLYIKENLDFLALAGICFIVPFSLGHPQIVVGVIVNAALFLSAYNLKGKELLAIAVMPSLGVLSRGILFGPFTIYLIYMLPFIWLGNYILMSVFRRIDFGRKWIFIIKLLASSCIKALFLFLSALALVNIGLIPAIFLTTMGIVQLWTALLGGLAARGLKQISHAIASRRQ